MTTINARKDTEATFSLVVSLYVWDCPTCGVTHGIPVEFADAKRANRGHYFCPNGHQLSWAESDADRLKRQLKYAQDAAAAERARADGAEASLRSTKGHVTRLRKRVAAGECPFCGQHLRDLQRHVNRQHADEAAATLAEVNAPE